MKKWIKIFYFIFITLLIVTIILKFDEIKDILGLIKNTNFSFILLAVTLVLAEFFLSSISYKLILSKMGYKIGLFKLLKIYLVMFSTNCIFPTMGMMGNTILFHSLKNHHKVNEGKILSSITIYTIAFLSSYLSILLFAAFYLVFIMKKILIGSIVLLAGVICAGIAILIAAKLIKNKDGFTKFLERLINKVLRFFKKKFNKPRFDYTINEFYGGLKIINDDKKHFFSPFLLLSVKHFMDMLSIYVIFASFGVNENIFLIMIAMSASLLISIASFIPGGIGIFEFSLAGIFVAFGVHLSLAIAVVLIFRAITFWIPLIVGAALYKHTLRI